MQQEESKYLSALELLKKTWLNPVKEVLEVQLRDGNWNFDPYMHGMANAMILMVALLEDKEPEFKNAPEKWLCDDCKQDQIKIEELPPIDKALMEYLEKRYLQKYKPKIMETTRPHMRHKEIFAEIDLETYKEIDRDEHSARNYNFLRLCDYPKPWFEKALEKEVGKIGNVHLVLKTDLNDVLTGLEYYLNEVFYSLKEDQPQRAEIGKIICQIRKIIERKNFKAM